MGTKNSKILYFLIMLILFLIISGLLIDGPGNALRSFFNLQVLPARLLNDFIQTGSIGGTLINAALVGAIGLFLTVILKVQLSGPTFAAIFTMIGFGFFGKTVFNIIPVITGVYLSAKIVRKMLREYIIIALFGTALGPLVSLISYEIGFTGIKAVIAGITGGIAAGFFLPAIAVAMLHLHQGYNLYNMGLSCGFFALFAASFVKATGYRFETAVEWYTEKSLVLQFLVPVISAVLITAGLISGGKKCLKDFRDIQKLSGRLPSDFMDLCSIEGSLLNSGLIGLAGSLYIYIIGGDFNGPVIGGLFTIMGFAAFGTHFKNSWPVVLGVILSSLLFSQNLSSPGPVLAVIFCTTLAPLAGQFGIFTGITAGFIHLVMVLQTGSWQGGLNLYNNGFAGGITATLIVSVIQWYRINKSDYS